jgi:hypothetical protein
MKLESKEGLEIHLTGKQYLEVLVPQVYSTSRNLKTVTRTGNPSRFSKDQQMLKLCTSSYNSAFQSLPLNDKAWRSTVRIPALKSSTMTVVLSGFPQSFQQTTVGTGPSDSPQLFPFTSFLFNVHNILPYHAVN